MFEDFKKKVKTYNNRPNRTLKTVKLTQDTTKLKHGNIDTCNSIFKHQDFSECLDDSGHDISLISGIEMEIMAMYTKTREYLLEKYPQTRQEANLHGDSWLEDPNAPIQINKAKALDDFKGQLFLS